VLKQIDRDVRRTMPSLSFFQSRVSRANRHVLARAANLPFNLVRRVHLEATASKKAPPPPFPVRARSARTSRNRPLLNVAREVLDACVLQLDGSVMDELHWQVIERILFVYAKVGSRTKERTAKAHADI